MKNYKRQPGDDLKSKDPRLRYRWKWIRIASGISEEKRKKWTHFQGSDCEPGGGWSLEALQWGGSEIRYSAAILYGGDTVVSLDQFETRLDAQLGAEALLEDWIRTEYERIVPK